ncbi:g7863 [Coccomyxa viridis]|uniref:G7863 protein n=1 Tax=Coccomyxa viridis TaxID=1274662 RepID=A0ABP1FYY0_9CHLO
MQPSLTLLALACVAGVLAKPLVYNTTLRESLFHGSAAEINRTADDQYDVIHNVTFLSTVRSTLTGVPTVYRHHGPIINETALLSSNYSRAQLETAFNILADIQYVHNSSMIDALDSPDVRYFSSSLSKGDRKQFNHLLDEQRKVTKSEFEAFCGFSTTKARVLCASSSPRGNLTAFTSCRNVSHSSQSSDLISPDDARRGSLVNLARTCFKYVVGFSMTNMGIHVSAIIATALRAPKMAFTLFVIGFIPLLAAWSSAGCVAYTAIAFARLDHKKDY